MLDLPALERLSKARSVLLAGAGGGFDVFAAIPLFLALRGQGVEVHLCSMSFTALTRVEVDWVAPGVARIDADSPSLPYFPERTLARWLRDRGIETSIYCFPCEGMEPARAAYAHLAATHRADAVVVVDGGSDALLRGDEFGLGTPVEDIVSVGAADSTGLPLRMLVSVGFGVDFFHGVCHAQVLRAIADLARVGGYWGAIGLVRGQPEVEAYLDLVDHLLRDAGGSSIVSASIADAIKGHFGDHHSTSRTAGSTLFINPLMGICWFFDLAAVARRVLYLDRIRDTGTWADVRRRIDRFRVEYGDIRPWEDIPV